MPRFVCTNSKLSFVVFFLYLRSISLYQAWWVQRGIHMYTHHLHIPILHPPQAVRLTRRPSQTGSRSGDWSSGSLARGWWGVRSRGQRVYRGAPVGDWLRVDGENPAAGGRSWAGRAVVDRPSVGRSSSSLCRRWLRWRRRRGSSMSSLRGRRLRLGRASTSPASRRRVEAIRAASCCPGEQPAGRPCPVLCAPSSRWGRSSRPPTGPGRTVNPTTCTTRC